MRSNDIFQYYRYFCYNLANLLEQNIYENIQTN